MAKFDFLLGWHFWLHIPVMMLVFFRVNIVAALFFNIKTRLTGKRINAMILAAFLYTLIRFASNFSTVTVPIAAVINYAYTHFLLQGRTLKEKIKVFLTDYIYMILIDMTAVLFPFFIMEKDTLSDLINSFTFEIVAYSILGICWLVKKYLLPRIKNINEEQISILSGVAAVLYVISGAWMGMVFAYQAPSDKRVYEWLLCLFLPSLSTITLFLINRYHTKKLKKSLEENERYRENIEGLYETTRVFRHDYKNAMLVLMGYAQEAGNEKIIKFLEQYTDEASFNNSIYVKSVADIPDAGLKNLIISKLLRARECGIKTVFLLSDDLKQPAIPMKVYSEIVGILLDNAIEGSENSAKPNISITLGNRAIHIVNSTAEKVGTSRVFERGYSTKAGHSGLGMYRLSQIAGKYESINYIVKSDENTFDVEVGM